MFLKLYTKCGFQPVGGLWVPRVKPYTFLGSAHTTQICHYSTRNTQNLMQIDSAQSAAKNFLYLSIHLSIYRIIPPHVFFNLWLSFKNGLRSKFYNYLTTLYLAPACGLQCENLMASFSNEDGVFKLSIPFAIS